MLCKLGATGPNFSNVIDDGIVYYSTKFYGIQIRRFLRYKLLKFGDFHIYCMAKWPGEHKLY